MNKKNLNANEIIGNKQLLAIKGGTSLATILGSNNLNTLITTATTIVTNYLASLDGDETDKRTKRPGN